MEQEKQAIFVLGMHRSGTSALTGVLSLLGVELGNRLMPAQADNELGYWEHADIVDVHDRLLKTLKARWDEPFSLPYEWWLDERVAPFRQEIIEILQRDFGQSLLWAVKDPRLCRLLPLWLPIIKSMGYVPKFIFIVRHPKEVSSSLAFRNGLPVWKSELLWLKYMLDAERDSRGCSRVFVGYRPLLDDWRSVTSKISHALSIRWPNNKQQSQQQIDKFLSPTLCHHIVDEKKTSHGLSNLHPWVRSAYKLLMEGASNQITADHEKRFSTLASKLQVSESFFAPWMEKIRHELPCLKEQLEATATEIKQMDLQIKDKDAMISERNQWLDERVVQFDKMQNDISERDSQIAGLNEALSERDSQIAGLNEALSERDSQIAGLNEALSERDGQIKILTDETVRRGEWASGLDAELKETQAKLITITQSNSWYLTKPLRETRRWIARPGYQARRYFRATLRLMKKGYQALPLSMHTKMKHRYLLSRIFPKLLLLSSNYSATPPSASVSYKSQLIPSHGNNLQDESVVIVVPTSDEPLVSIIIPIYGKLEYTLHCLDSIAKNLPEAAFEIIVIDDCSPDNSVNALRQVQGIRLIQNHENQGFIRSCNIGAQTAKGQYLLFLNNDTQVTPNWLDELLHTFDQFPGTGLVGSKLVYPDGRLQEAGGIIWQDGSAWNFGRFQSPDLPVYNYAREVDYCSGASIMTPKVLFEELGGFDEYYLPAYYEDTDLAMKIRAKGYRVIYQPFSTLIHYEGVTSGTDLNQGTKAYQQTNREKFFERWKNQLECHEKAGDDVDKAKDRKAVRRILVLDHCTPTPDQDSGSIDIYNIMLLFREMEFQVTFIPEDNFMFMNKHTQSLQSQGVEMLYAPYVTSVESHLKEFGSRYDLVLLVRPNVAMKHIGNVRKLCSKARIWFHTVDLHFIRMLRESEINTNQNNKNNAEQMRQCELRLMQQADVTTVVSEYELSLLSDMLPEENIKLLPFSRSCEGTTYGFESRADIVFVGNYQHTPNIDAVQYFVAEMMPLLRQRLPNVRFFAVGCNPPEEIQKLASEDVIITGFVEDLNPLLDKMRVSVAPLRYGAGIKGKIGAAMAVGLPVVATALAAEGMSLTDGKNILIANQPQRFVDAVVQLYQDEQLWNQLSKDGLDFAERTWGAETVWKTLANILGNMGLQVHRGSYPLTIYRPSIKVTSETCSACWNELHPILVASDRKMYEQGLKMSRFSEIRGIERNLIETFKTESFTLDGFCIPCNKKVPFLIDMQSGGKIIEAKRVPNWRERLVCPCCQMNNRQRLMATLIKQYLMEYEGKNVYFMEQVTPIYQWAVKAFPKNNIIGSEYLGYEYKSGDFVSGIRHEDVENMSFSSQEFDLIISNDVFEHVPNPSTAFKECMRVLKTGGVMLATIPFHSKKDLSIIRAKMVDGQLEHVLPPVYHGNPVSADGSLVFTDFGWDIIEDLRSSGFSDVKVEIFASLEYGHLGGGQLVFKVVR